MKATKEQIIAEANRRRAEHGEGAPPVEHFIVDVVCENWTPPEPEPVDPDILAFREWGERRFGVNTASAYRLGDCDDTAIAQAYLAGARMATERERERARLLVEYVDGHAYRPDGVARQVMKSEILAREALAKYRGEA